MELPEGSLLGSPLSPRVCVCQEKVCMEQVGPEDTGFPLPPPSSGQFLAATARRPDDVVVVRVTKEAVVRQL